jgi:hypothetical protein
MLPHHPRLAATAAPHWLPNGRAADVQQLQLLSDERAEMHSLHPPQQ